jgi:hypothetical protein
VFVDSPQKRVGLLLLSTLANLVEPESEAQLVSVLAGIEQQLYHLKSSLVSCFHRQVHDQAADRSHAVHILKVECVFSVERTAEHMLEQVLVLVGANKVHQSSLFHRELYFVQLHICA